MANVGSDGKIVLKVQPDITVGAFARIVVALHARSGCTFTPDAAQIAIDRLGITPSIPVRDLAPPTHQALIEALESLEISCTLA